MSDDNKIIRVTDIVTPVDGDFAGRVVSSFDEVPAERALDSKGETLGVFNKAVCPRRYKETWCRLALGHGGAHWNDAYGWEDVESDKLVGSPTRIPPAPKGKFLSSAQMLAFAKNRDAPLADGSKKQPLKPKKPWTVNIGMPNGSTILPGQSVTVTEMMQIVFRAKQLVCAPSGGKLYITTALVGQRIQLMQWSGNGMLMDFLKERIDVDFDTAEPGIMIAFTIVNRGDTPGTFDLSLFGEAVF